jgi:hypothetical protein
MGGVTVDITAVAAIWIGGVLLLVPLLALLLRFGVIPLIGTIAEFRRGRAEDQDLLKARIDALEDRLRRIESRRIVEERGVGVA